MGLPVSGSWYTRYANEQAYVGAQRWGTGNNPIHEVYGVGPPLRTTGRLPGPDQPTAELSDVPAIIETPYEYGYCMEDIQTQGYYSGFLGAPWGSEDEGGRYAVLPVGAAPMGTDDGTGEQPSWDVTSSDPEMTEYRLEPGADPALWSGIRLVSFPTESVTEGWRNKETGAVADARTSDQIQYERQTSMQQVNPPEGRNNQAAVVRATDDPRFNILTRLTGQKIKPWSQGQRNEDMFPYQQDLIIRPFWYRIAATDDPAKLAPNEMYVSDPIQRDVPPSPYLGPEETNVYSIEENGGYTSEDMSYA
jgi:hypothetical protein